jgi:hypothetical protein
VVKGRRLPTLLVRCLFPAHVCDMFVVTEADAAAIRAIFERDGELVSRHRGAQALFLALMTTRRRAHMPGPSLDGSRWNGRSLR